MCYSKTEQMFCMAWQNKMGTDGDVEDGVYGEGRGYAPER